MGKNTTTYVAGALALAILAYIVFFGGGGAKREVVVEQYGCPEGTERFGEGCMPHKDACELRGDEYQYDDVTEKCVNTAKPQDPKTMEVQIALLDTTGGGTGKSRGCDTVNMVKRTVPYSKAALDASLKALFAEPERIQPDTEYNFMARTRQTLKYDRAIITNGMANIYLTGSLSGLAGVCDDPRASSQLVETALQFPTVKNVQLYLNGQPTTLMPSQQ